MKRLSARQYATAVDRALHESKRGVGAIATALLERLRRDRAMRLLPRVLDHVRNVDAARRGRQRVTIEAASIDAADAVTEKLKNADVTVHIRPELRRGVAVTINDQRIDASLAGRIEQLTKTLHTHA